MDKSIWFLRDIVNEMGGCLQMIRGKNE